MTLTSEQIERYARHLVLKEVGGPGQQKLLKSRVLVVGAGGIGAPCLLYLAAAGVGTIGIVDDDAVALSNLQRQVLYRSADIGRPKAKAAREVLTALNPDVEIVPYAERLTAANAQALVAEYDIVAEGVDNFATRFVLNQACLAAKKPWVSAAVGRFDGQVTLYQPHMRPGGRRIHPCYRCLVPEAPPNEAAQSCTEVGILGAVTGVIGSLQAVEVIKALLELGQSLAGRLLLYDALNATTRTVALTPDPECPACAAPRAQ